MQRHARCGPSGNTQLYIRTIDYCSRLRHNWFLVPFLGVTNAFHKIRCPKVWVPPTHPKLDHLSLEAHGSGDPNHHPSQFLFIPRGTIRAGILKTSSGRAEALWSLKTPSSVDRWIWSGSCGVEPLFWLNMGVKKSHKKSPGLRDKSSETGPFSMVILCYLCWFAGGHPPKNQ